MMPQTEVCITIDTEFSIGGHFDSPEQSPIGEPMVVGMVDGREHGLGFLLESFAEYGFRATFFVEALQTAYFGDEPMGRIARRIAVAGHDVQLHVHPCWLYFERPPIPPMAGTRNDSCAGRSSIELDHIFSVGISAFARWQLPRPTAVRPGNFQSDIGFYEAAARAGMRTSSSIAVPIFTPTDQRLILMGGKHRIHHILELPVLAFSWGYGRYRRLRSLAITACSNAEMICALQQARRQNISPVVILTHPQEFIKRQGPNYATLRRNRVNQRRLRSLLQFLDRHREEYSMVPVSAIEDRLDDEPAPSEPAIFMPFCKAIARTVENGINDQVWWY